MVQTESGVLTVASHVLAGHCHDCDTFLCPEMVELGRLVAKWRATNPDPEIRVQIISCNDFRVKGERPHPLPWGRTRDRIDKP